MEILSSKSNLADPTTSANDYYNADATYHKKLNTQHVDLPGNEESVPSELIMICTSKIGRFISPRVLILIFRLLKNVTFCCLLLTIISELMYILIMILVDGDLLKVIGGTRDAMLRGYGILLCIFAIFIERDMELVDIHYPGMKKFIPRSCLLSFISFLTCTIPIIGSGLFNLGDESALEFSGFYGFSVGIQNIASHALWIGACTYFLFGILCLDRFTADAFLAEEEEKKDFSERDIGDTETITIHKVTGDTLHTMDISDKKSADIAQDEIGNITIMGSSYIEEEGFEEETPYEYKPPLL